MSDQPKVENQFGAFVSKFASKDGIYFLTFRGNKPVHERIEFVRKHCNKVSKNYIAVREKNKKTEGYHFHVLLHLSEMPNKAWFMKGCHFNLQKLGGKTVIPGVKPLPYRDPHYESKQDLFQKCQDLEESYDEAILDQCMAKLVDRMLTLDKRAIHVSRVLTYMSKELEFPRQYHDYIVLLDGKITSIP